MNPKNLKAGLFVFVSLILLFALILRVSQGRLFFGNTYTLSMDVDSAVGVAKNTPVQIAGVDIGVVESISLADNTRARLVLAINKGVPVSSQAVGHIKTTGILGDAYVEIFQEAPLTQLLKHKDVIQNVEIHGDLSSVTNQFSGIASDVKAITAQMKKLMAGDDSAFDKTIRNLEKITDAVARLSAKNEKNIDAIVANLKAMSENLNMIVASNVSHSASNIDKITTDLEQGRGTVGRLLKDETTVDKLHDALDNLNNAIGGLNKMNVELGGHTEYLAGTGSFKNYVTLSLQPRPDKFFRFDAVSDPDPSFQTTVEETTVTSGATSSTITTERRTKNLNDFLFSAQFGKKFRDFTVRGGVIESSGGVGLDYSHGPLGIEFSAFDFKSDHDERPHLKAMGTMQLTRTFYLLGGVDDFINRDQDLDWYVGAGLRFTDNDIKSLLGLISAGAR